MKFKKNSTLTISDCFLFYFKKSLIKFSFFSLFFIILLIIKFNEGFFTLNNLLVIIFLILMGIVIYFLFIIFLSFIESLSIMYDWKRNVNYTIIMTKDNLLIHFSIFNPSGDPLKYKFKIKKCEIFDVVYPSSIKKDNLLCHPAVPLSRRITLIFNEDRELLVWNINRRGISLKPKKYFGKELTIENPNYIFNNNEFIKNVNGT